MISSSNNFCLRFSNFSIMSWLNTTGVHLTYICYTNNIRASYRVSSVVDPCRNLCINSLSLERWFTLLIYVISKMFTNYVNWTLLSTWMCVAAMSEKNASTFKVNKNNKQWTTLKYNCLLSINTISTTLYDYFEQQRQSFVACRFVNKLWPKIHLVVQ